ncbi:MAG: hypothetical protein AAFQ87_25205, partial [Bacteroidota bacterium]
GPKDLALAGLLSPVQNLNAVCAGTLDSVIVNVFNFGTDTVDFTTDNAQVTIDVTGVNPAMLSTTLNTGFLAPGASTPVLVDPAYDMTAVGNYIFDGYIEFTTGGPDANLANDTLSTATIGIGGTTVITVSAAQPWTEDFESFGVGSPGILQNGWTRSTQASFYEWFVEDASGANENSTGTGPFFDNTNFGTPGGIYMYTESSSGATGDEISLISPCLDLSATTAPRLEFAYHMFGTAMGNLYVEVEAGGPWVAIDSILGQQQTLGSDAWLTRSIDMSAYAGQVIKIRFVGQRGTSFTSDMAIDDVSIFQPITQDASIISASGPTIDCGLTANETITGILQNVGSDTIFGGVDVNYSINGVAGTATTINSTIAPDSTVMVSFSNIDFSAPGIYDVCIFNLNLAGDINLSNDSTCFIVENNTTIVSPTSPYFEDFESFTVGNPGNLNNGWTRSAQGAGYNWFVEDASGANENSTGTGPFFDNTNFGTPGGIYMYTESSSGLTGAEVSLISPCIDLSATTSPRLEFAYHMFGAAMGNLYKER